MHSLNHVALGQVVAADRVRPVPRAVRGKQRRRSPPVRRHAAHLAARVARRLDAEAARNVVA
jgi:hypothetical protein